MLTDMMKDVEQKAGAALPAPPEAPRLIAADREVIHYFVERLRRQILAEIAAQNVAWVAPARPYSAAVAGVGAGRGLRSSSSSGSPATTIIIISLKSSI